LGVVTRRQTNCAVGVASPLLASMSSRLIPDTLQEMLEAELDTTLDNIKNDSKDKQSANRLLTHKEQKAVQLFIQNSSTAFLNTYVN